MITRGSLVRRVTALFAVVVPAAAALAAGCASEPDEAVGSAEQADKYVSAPASPLYDPACAPAGSHVASQPVHEAKTCGDPDGFTFGDAVAQCGAKVKYFGYYCSDFAAAPPYAPTATRRISLPTSSFIRSAARRRVSACSPCTQGRSSRACR